MRISPQHRLVRFSRRDFLFPAILLAIATLLAYFPATRCGYIWDDDVYVTGNPLLTAPDGLRRIWFSLDSPSQYFPLVYTTFRIEHALWGLNPAGYHWANILLHTANALLLWRLLTRLRVPGAWLAAALFALHPVQVESVAWITERKNVLMGFFFLLSLRAWVEFIGNATKRKWMFYALALVCYALALFSKTTACTLPAALLLVLWLKKRPVDWSSIAEIAPFLLLGFCMGLVTVWWERFHQGTQGKLFAMGPLERLLVASHAIWFYAGKLLWPTDLAFSYPRWTVSAANPTAWLWLLALAGSAALIFCARRTTGRGVEVPAIFFVATLSPVLGFIMLYTFRYSFVADHYQYLACIGPLALAAAATSTLTESYLPRKLAWLKPASCAILLALLGALSWKQCAVYADLPTLWKSTLAKNPESWLAHNNLGLELVRQGKMDEAIKHYRKALQINPDYEEVHSNLGEVLIQQGQTGEAIVEFHKALQINPSFLEARNNLGVALLQQGHIDEALAQYREALRINPDYSQTHYNLGNAFLGQGRAEDAVAQYREALRINPDNADARINYGNTLLQQGRTDEAFAQFHEALRINPARADVHYNLGVILLQQGREDEAAARFHEALHINPALPEARNNLGLILLQQGRTDDAVAEYHEALRINPSYAEAQNNLGKALLQQGRTNDAIVALDKALELQPANASIQNNLAWMLATASDPSLRNAPKAVALAQKASQSAGGSNPQILRTLAIAYAAVGDFSNALQTARKALPLVETESNLALANALRKEIKNYEAHMSDPK